MSKAQAIDLITPPLLMDSLMHCYRSRTGQVPATHFPGTLSIGLSVAVFAHVELCTSCRDPAGALAAEATRAWLQDPQPESVSHSCLCFAVLDSPLTFTRGLARLLNPILRYRFNRATAGSA